MNRPLVGVVVPVYNDWQGLQLCLEALARQTYPAALLLVRVVDNGSSDWPDDPGFPGAVEVIREARPGSYGARNRAALGWGVDVLAFTDADCRPDPKWVERGVEALLRPWPKSADGGGLVAGRIILEPRSSETPTAAEQLDQILGFDQERTVRRGGFAVTANLFVPQSFFELMGGFNSHARSGGDRDFCERARAHGLTLRYCANALVHHPCREWQALQAKQKRIVGGRLALAGPLPQARLHVLLLSFRPLLSESWRVWRYAHLSLRRRLHLQVLVIRLRWVVFLEWLRLQRLGQMPLR